MWCCSDRHGGNTNEAAAAREHVKALLEEQQKPSTSTSSCPASSWDQFERDDVKQAVSIFTTDKVAPSQDTYSNDLAHAKSVIAQPQRQQELSVSTFAEPASSRESSQNESTSESGEPHVSSAALQELQADHPVKSSSQAEAVEQPDASVQRQPSREHPQTHTAGEVPSFSAESSEISRLQLETEKVDSTSLLVQPINEKESEALTAPNVEPLIESPLGYLMRRLSQATYPTEESGE